MASDIQNLLVRMAPRKSEEVQGELLKLADVFYEFQTFGDLVPYYDMGFLINQDDDITALMKLLRPRYVASGNEEFLNRIRDIEKEFTASGCGRYHQRTQMRLNSYWGNDAFFSVGERPIFEPGK